MCMDEDAIDEVKELMWDFGLTRHEAVSYVLHTHGRTQVSIARELGVDPSLISKRITSAKVKVNGS